MYFHKKPQYTGQLYKKLRLQNLLHSFSCNALVHDNHCLVWPQITMSMEWNGQLILTVWLWIGCICKTALFQFFEFLSSEISSILINFVTRGIYIYCLHWPYVFQFAQLKNVGPVKVLYWLTISWHILLIFFRTLDLRLLCHSLLSAKDLDREIFENLRQSFSFRSVS